MMTSQDPCGTRPGVVNNRAKVHICAPSSFGKVNTLKQTHQRKHTHKIALSSTD